MLQNVGFTVNWPKILCRVVPFVAVATIVSACTYAATSTIPVEIQGGDIAYRYEGRANFPHQIAEADRAMTAQCLKANGGKPVIVNLQKRTIGVGGIANTSTTGRVDGTLTGSNYQGTGATFGTGLVSTMANQNQEILYRCVK